MKKIIFPLALILFIISPAAAQMTPRTEKTQIKKIGQPQVIKPIIEEPKAPPPPAPVTKEAAGTNTNTQNTLVYTLTAVRVNIRTGSDNKEFLSAVTISLWNKSRQRWDYPNECYYITPQLKNEMAVNSNTDLGLDKYPGNPGKLTLANVQAGGLDLVIEYAPNLLFDAWKIENISLTLEFRDQNGNLHPTFGNKTISFSNAIGFLNAEFRSITCKTDQNFNPLTASIGK